MVGGSWGGGIGSGSGGVVAGHGGGIGGGVFHGQGAAPPTVAPQKSLANNEVLVPAVAVDAKPAGERAILESKLHPALLEAFDCWQKSGQECKLVKDGMIEVQLWLTDDSSAVLEQIKALGFKMSEGPAKGKVIVGQMPVGKLVDLAKISNMQFASPVRR